MRTPMTARTGSNHLVDGEIRRTPRPANRNPLRRAARHGALAAVAGIFILIIVACLMAINLVQGRREMLNAAVTLRAAAPLASPALLRDRTQRKRFRAGLITAGRELRAARGHIVPWNPILSRAGWMPIVGSELAAAPAISTASLDAVDATLGTLAGLRPSFALLGRPGATSPSMSELTLALSRGSGDFRQAARTAAEGRAAIAGLPSSRNATVDAAVHQLRGDLPALEAATRWLAASPALLGVGQASRELILIQDPRELRATGGFIGASGLVTFRNGAMSRQFGSSVLPHEIQSVPPPAPEMLYTPESAWLFRDSNWSPDFPLSARLARWFYGKDTGQWADGVIAVQTSLAPPLLAITGPVYLPAYGRWVTAGTVATIANQYINGQYHGPMSGGGQDTVRKQFVGDVFAAVLGRLATLPASRWPDLVAVLTRAAMQRTIMLYDHRSAIEAAIRAIHAGGTFAPPNGDMLAIVDDNRSYNKINPYVQERATDTVRIQPNLDMAVTLRIRYHVLPSPANIEGCGPFCGLDGTVHDYQDFLRVFVPNGARITKVRGIDAWKPRSAYGMVQIAGRLLVREGETRLVTIQYHLPANVLQATGFTAYRLTVWHQPGTARRVTVRIEGAGGVRLDGRPAVGLNLRVSSDQRIDLPITGAGAPGTVALPPRVWKDPYIPDIPYVVLTASKRPL